MRTVSLLLMAMAVGVYGRVLEGAPTPGPSGTYGFASDMVFQEGGPDIHHNVHRSRLLLDHGLTYFVDGKIKCDDDKCSETLKYVEYTPFLGFQDKSVISEITEKLVYVNCTCTNDTVKTFTPSPYKFEDLKSDDLVDVEVKILTSSPGIKTQVIRIIMPYSTNDCSNDHA